MRNITLKQFIKISLYIALSVTLGKAIISMPGFSAGELMQTLLPPALFGFLLLLLEIEAFPIKWTSWVSIFQLPGKRDLSIKLALVMIPLSVMVGITLIYYGCGLTITLSFLLASAGVLISGILIASDKQAVGLSLLIITLPIVHFLEFEFRIYHNAYHGVFYIMPSIIILWVIAFEFLFIHLFRKRSFMSTSFNKVWLLIFITMLFSAIFSNNYVLSFRHVFYFISISIPFFLAVNTIYSLNELKLCTISLALGAGVEVLRMLYFEMGKMSAAFEYQPRVYDSLPSYSGILGLGIVFCFFLSLGLMMSEKFKSKRILVFSGITGLLLITALKLPRSMDIALTCGILVLLLLHRKRWWIMGGSIVLILVMFSSLDWIRENTALGRFEQFSSIESFRTSQGMRLEGYQAATSMIKDHPTFGIGPGMWDDYYFNYMRNPPIFYDKGRQVIVYIRAAHNIFLHHGATSGIGGIISVIVLAYMTIKSSILLFRSQHGGFFKDLAVSFVAISIACWTMWTLGGGAFEISFSPDEHYWFWLFLGLIAAWLNINKGLGTQREIEELRIQRFA